MSNVATKDPPHPNGFIRDHFLSKNSSKLFPSSQQQENSNASVSPSLSRNEIESCEKDEKPATQLREVGTTSPSRRRLPLPIGLHPVRKLGGRSVKRKKGGQGSVPYSELPFNGACESTSTPNSESVKGRADRMPGEPVDTPSSSSHLTPILLASRNGSLRSTLEEGCSAPLGSLITPSATSMGKKKVVERQMQRYENGTEALLTSSSEELREKDLESSSQHVHTRRNKITEKEPRSALCTTPRPDGSGFSSFLSSPQRTVLRKPAMTPLWPLGTSGKSPPPHRAPTSSVAAHASSSRLQVVETILLDGALTPFLPSRSPPQNPISCTPSRSMNPINAIQPDQFKRAIQLINAMVKNERNTAEASKGRCRESGWTMKWVRSVGSQVGEGRRERERSENVSTGERPLFSSTFSSGGSSPGQGSRNHSASIGTSTISPATPEGDRTTGGSKSEKRVLQKIRLAQTMGRGAAQAVFPLQPVWLVTDGSETLLLIDFNGSDEHENYKESLLHYLEQLASAQNRKEVTQTFSFSREAESNLFHAETFSSNRESDIPLSRGMKNAEKDLNSIYNNGGSSSNGSLPLVDVRRIPEASVVWFSLNVEDLLATASPDGCHIPVGPAQVTSLHLLPPFSSAGASASSSHLQGSSKPTPRNRLNHSQWCVRAGVPSISKGGPPSSLTTGQEKEDSMKHFMRVLQDLDVPFAKAQALLLCMKGSILVKEILEELCNGYLPLFLEGPYSSGVLLEGRWCKAAPSSPGVTQNHAPSFIPLWRSASHPSPALAEVAANSERWNALFPAVGQARREAELARQLGEIVIPTSVLSEMEQITMAHFPSYLPLPRPTPHRGNASPEGAWKMSSPHATPGDTTQLKGLPHYSQGSPSPSSHRTFIAASDKASNGTGSWEDGRIRSPLPNREDFSGSVCSFLDVFTGAGHRLGGTLGEVEARERMRKAVTRSKPAGNASSSFPSSPDVVTALPENREDDAESVTPTCLTGASKYSNAFRSPPLLSSLPPKHSSGALPFDNARVRPSSTFSSSLCARRGPNDGGYKSGLAQRLRSLSAYPSLPVMERHSRAGTHSEVLEDMAHVGILVATGPLYRTVWEAYRRGQGSHLEQQGKAESSLKMQGLKKYITPPTLCTTVLIYTPFGKIYLERLLSSVERWEFSSPSTGAPHDSLSGTAVDPASSTSSSSSMSSPPPAVLDTPMVKVKDCRTSLLRSAFGRSMRLREDQIQFVVAPGTPMLSSQDIISTSQAVLRMVRDRRSI